MPASLHDHVNTLLQTARLHSKGERAVDEVKLPKVCRAGSMQQGVHPGRTVLRAGHGGQDDAGKSLTFFDVHKIDDE